MSKTTRSGRVAAPAMDLQQIYGLVKSSVYGKDDLLSKAQAMSSDLKPGSNLRCELKPAGLSICCNSQGCKFGLNASLNRSDSNYRLDRIRAEHSPSCGRPTQGRRGKPDPKQAKIRDNTSGDETVPDADLEEIAARYASSSRTPSLPPAAREPSTSTSIDLEDSPASFDVKPNAFSRDSSVELPKYTAKRKRREEGSTHSGIQADHLSPQTKHGSESSAPPMPGLSPAILPSFKNKKLPEVQEMQEAVDVEFNPDTSAFYRIVQQALPQGRHVNNFYAAQADGGG